MATKRFTMRFEDSRDFMTQMYDLERQSDIETSSELRDGMVIPRALVAEFTIDDQTAEIKFIGVSAVEYD